MLTRRRLFNNDSKIKDRLIIIKLNVQQEIPIVTLLGDYLTNDDIVICDGYLDNNPIINWDNSISVGKHEIRIVMNTKTMIENSDLYWFFCNQNSMAQGTSLAAYTYRYELYNIDGGDCDTSCGMGFLSSVYCIDGYPSIYMYNCKCRHSAYMAFAGSYTDIILENCIFYCGVFIMGVDNKYPAKVKLLNCEFNCDVEFGLGFRGDLNSESELDINSSVIYSPRIQLYMPCKPKCIGVTEIIIAHDLPSDLYGVFDLTDTSFEDVYLLDVRGGEDIYLRINGPAPALIDIPDNNYYGTDVIVHYTGDLSNAQAIAPGNGVFLPI